MAIDSGAFSPKQFRVAIAEQDDWGTITPASGSPDNDWLEIDIDSVSSPVLNVVQVAEPRAGSRITNATDFFQDNKNKVIEIAVSGTLTTEIVDLLLSNWSQGDSVVYGIASNIAVQNMTSATVNQTANQLLSLQIVSPTTNKALGFKDVFCTALTFSGDAGTEGGRIKFSATFKTGSIPDLSLADIAIDTIHSANFDTMSAWDADDRIICGHANVLVNSFSLNLENDVTFAGITATGFESASRLSEIIATADFSIKYDGNTDLMFENFHDQASGSAEGATLMSHTTAPADGTFGFAMANSVITSLAFNEGDIMMLDVSVKALGNGIGSSTKLVSIGI